MDAASADARGAVTLRATPPASLHLSQALITALIGVMWHEVVF